MSFLTHHYLTITDCHGVVICGKVVYLQPVEDRWLEDTAELHVMTSDWLEQHRYSAIYHTSTESSVGFFTAHKSRQIEGCGYVYEGMFEKIAERSPS